MNNQFKLKASDLRKILSETIEEMKLDIAGSPFGSEPSLEDDDDKDDDKGSVVSMNPLLDPHSQKKPVDEADEEVQAKDPAGRHCDVCGHDHQDPRHVDCDCDYEPCGYCGYDHEYEYVDAKKWHMAHPGEGYEKHAAMPKKEAAEQSFGEPGSATESYRRYLAEIEKEFAINKSECTKCYKPIPDGQEMEAFGVLYHEKCAPKNAKPMK